MSRKLLLSLFILFILEGAALLMDIHGLELSFAKTGTHEIGFIEKKENEVQYREKGSLSWEDANESQSMKYYDSILTLSGSKAKVKLKDVGTVIVDENSMIFFEPPKESQGPIQLKLGKGSFKITTASRKQVGTGKDVIDLWPGSEMKVTMDKNKNLSYVTLKGKAEIVGTNEMVQPIQVSDNVDPLNFEVSRNIASTVDTEIVTPAIAPPEVSIESKLSPPEVEKDLLFGLSARTFFSRLEGRQISNSTTGVFISPMNYGLEADLNQKWTESVRSKIYLDVSHQSYETTANRTISGSQTFSGFGIAVTSKTSEKMFVSLDAAMIQEPFYHSTDVINFNIDAVPISQLSLSTRNILFSSPTAEGGLELKGTYLASATTDSYSIGSGYGYAANVFLDQKVKKTPIETNIYISRNQQNTSLVEISLLQVGIQMRFKIDIGN